MTATALSYFSTHRDSGKLSTDQLKLSIDDVSATVTDLQTTVHTIKMNQSAFEREFPDVLRQLDILAGQLEREKGDVAVLKEQLAFLAQGGARGARNASNGDSGSTGLYAFLIGFVRHLYTPFLYFVRGMYVLLSPVAITFRCLTVFRGRGQKDRISDDEDESAPSDPVTHAKQLKNEVGYLLMALSSNPQDGNGRRYDSRSSRSSKSSGVTPAAAGGGAGGLVSSVEGQTPLETKRTPQRGTELFSLLQHTKIDSRTSSGAKR